MISNLCFWGLLGLAACLGLGLWLGTREKKPSTGMQCIALRDIGKE